MIETREFSSDAVASLATGRLYGDFSEMHELAAFLLGRPLFDIALPAHFLELSAELTRQFPGLPGFDQYIGVDALHERMGRTLTVARSPSQAAATEDGE